MHKSTKTILSLGCAGIGVIGVVIAVVIGGTIFGVVRTINKNVRSGYDVESHRVTYYSGLDGFGPPQSWEIPEADAATFEVLTEYYAKDKNNAYLQGKMIPQSSGASFEIIRFPYAKDQHHIFYTGSVISDAPNNFKFLTRDDKGTFATDGEKIFLEEKALYPGTLDPASFVRIGEGEYFKDKQHIYTFEKIIEAADPATFAEILGYGGNYSSDKNGIYFKNVKVKNCDTKTHKILDDNFHTDARSVFYGTQKISDDPNNFELLKAQYSRDGVNVYWKDKKIGTESGHFTAFPTISTFGFGKDGRNVYWCNKIITGADPASFEGLSEYYGKDKNHIWYGTYEEEAPTILEAADPATFEISGREYDAKDKSNNYHFGKVVAPQ